MDRPRRTRPVLLIAFALAVVVQLVGLYWPSPPAAVSALAGWDKVTHALMFGLPVLAGLAGGLSRVPLVLVSVAHAPVSEWLQGSVLPHRSADWRDVLADLAGIVVAVALWSVIGGQDRARSGARSGT